MVSSFPLTTLDELDQIGAVLYALLIAPNELSMEATVSCMNNKLQTMEKIGLNCKSQMYI